MSDFDGILNPSSGWPDVPQASVSMRLLGGEDGPLNAQALALAARTEQLKIFTREALRHIHAEAGLTLVSGSFETGATITSATDALLWGQNGVAYVWTGTLPHDVAAGTVPTSSPNWVSAGGYLLRTQLAAPDGTSLIGGISSVVDVGKVPKFSDTAGVPTLTIPDNASKRLFINKECTHADDFSVMQIARHANYSGGTAGYVGTAIQAKTYVEPTATATSEWTALFQIDNYAPNNPAGGGPGSGALPQNVAIYGQAQKRNTGSTWALCTEINDHLTAANGAAIGHELACSANGADDATYPQRNSSHVAIGKLVSGGLDLEWGRGYWVSTSTGARVRYSFDNTAAIGDSVLHNKGSASSANSALIRDEGSLVEGIDLSAATYSSNRAIKLKLGQKISFDPEGTNTIFANAAGLIFSTRANLQSSFGMPSSGNTATTATAGSRTLPANPAGFLIFYLDGSPFKIPYYG